MGGQQADFTATNRLLAGVVGWVTEKAHETRYMNIFAANREEFLPVQSSYRKKPQKDAHKGGGQCE